MRNDRQKPLATMSAIPEAATAPFSDGGSTKLEGPPLGFGMRGASAMVRKIDEVNTEKGCARIYFGTKGPSRMHRLEMSLGSYGFSTVPKACFVHQLTLGVRQAQLVYCGHKISAQKRRQMVSGCRMQTCQQFEGGSRMRQLLDCKRKARVY